MGRRKRAWLAGGTGRRTDRGRALAGFYVEWNDYDASHRRIHRSRHFDKIADARHFLRRFNARRDLDIDDIVPSTIADVLEEFIGGLASVTADWRQEYLAALSEFDSFIDGAPIANVTGRDIDRLTFHELSRTDKVRSPSTIAKRLQMLSRFFNWCVKRKYARENPIKAATSRPRVMPRQRPNITEADIERLIASIDTEDRRVAVWLAMTTGLDRGIIQRLVAGQVDVDNECLIVVRPKTGERLRVPIHRSLLSFFGQRIRWLSATDPVLNGLSRQNRVKRSDWWADACKAANLERLWFRDLRAVASSRLQRAGAPIGDAQRLLGHRSPSTTATYYHIPDSGIAERIHSIPLPGHPGSATATGPPPVDDGPPASQ